MNNEWKKKISQSLIGRRLTKTHKKNISKAIKGRPISEETKEKISKKLKGRVFSQERNKKISNAHKGKKLSEKTKKRISKALAGEKHYNWCGGLSRKHYSYKFNKSLKEKIKKRDKYICQECEDKNDLTIHHIDYNKKNCEESNLITLCRKCNTKANFGREDWMIYFRNKLKKYVN